MSDKSSDAGGAMRVDSDLVRSLAALLHESDLSEIEVAEGDRRIVVKRKIAGPAAAAYAPPPPPQSTTGAPGTGATAEVDHPGAIKSPMVGTAFLAGEPGAKPFVAPGDTVSEGDTLLIIEAMKVMNPIASTKSGTVRQVLVVDGQPVEYDQPLVIVE